VRAKEEPEKGSSRQDLKAVIRSSRNANAGVNSVSFSAITSFDVRCSQTGKEILSFGKCCFGEICRQSNSS